MIFVAEGGVGVVSATVAPGGNLLSTVEPGARGLPEFGFSERAAAIGFLAPLVHVE